MKHIKKIKIDIDKKNCELIPSVQYDSNTRFLHINLLNSSVPFNLSGCSVKIAATKPDGTAIFNNCTIIDAKQGFIEAELTEQLNAAAGTVKAEIKIYDTKGVLTTKHFDINVTASVTSKEITSSNEFNALTDALQVVQGIDNKANKKDVDELNVIFEEAVANVTNGHESSTNTEIVSARGGMPSLKLRINSMENANSYNIKDVIPLCIKKGFLSNETGGSVSEGQDANWKLSDYIEVDERQGLYYDAYASSSMASIGLYDKNKKKINLIIGTEKNLHNFVTSVCFNKYRGVKYIRICYSATATHRNTVFLFTNSTEIKNEIDKLNVLIDEIAKTNALPLINNIGYISPTGVIHKGDNHWRYSDPLFIDFEYIDINVISSSDISTISFYDDKDNFLDRISSDSKSASVLQGKFKRSNFPEGTAYIRLCIATNDFLPYNSIDITFEYSVKETSTKLRNDIQNIDNVLHSSCDLISECNSYGYINREGMVVSTDTNWKHSDFILLTKTGRIRLKLLGHRLVSTLVLYDSAKRFIASYGTDDQSNAGAVYELNIDVASLPSQAKYFRICYGIQNLNATHFAHYGFERINALEEKISFMEDGTKLDLSYIVPPKIYCTCNDTISNLKGHNRNYKASIYLDHMICEDFNEEKHIRFKNDSDKLDLYSPIKVMDANESNPTVKYNEGVNILEKEIPIIITGRDVLSKEYKTKLISTLNSITKNVTPRVLCIGDSITYAELATIEDDGYSQNWAYHLMCKELFMKDRIDNGNTGHDIKFLGHFKKTRTMRYKNADYPITTFHEGIRGISLSQYLNGEVEDFKSPTTNKFSIKAWLDKYRTLDDNGNRLRVGNGTGTLINSGNINDIDVCTPTHILLMLSSNKGFTIEQYRELVAIIKNELPNVIIGLAVPDVASTHFPSLHPKCGENTYMWNSGHEKGHSYTYHKQQYKCMKMLLEEYSNKENENIYIVPFFFTNPGAESSAMRTMYGMDSNFEIMKDNITIEQYGWVPNVHINAIGHSNWAYQLYSWLKYTIAKNK